MKFLLPMKTWKKNRQKYHTLPKLQKISVLAWLPKRAQNTEFRFTKILLIHDWVFRLGPLQLFAIHLSLSLVYGQSWNICMFIHTYQINVRWVYLAFSKEGKNSKISVYFNSRNFNILAWLGFLRLEKFNL